MRWRTTKIYMSNWRAKLDSRPTNARKWYSGNWISSDGDGVTLCILEEDQEFELYCFSGISASWIIINSLDFSCFPTIEHSASFEDQCFQIADQLCEKFCEPYKFF